MGYTYVDGTFAVCIDMKCFDNLYDKYFVFPLNSIWGQCFSEMLLTRTVTLYI